MSEIHVIEHQDWLDLISGKIITIYGIDIVLSDIDCTQMISDLEKEKKGEL